MLFHVVFREQTVNREFSFYQSVFEKAINGRIDDHDINSKIIKW